MPYYEKAEQLASNNKLEPLSHIAPVPSERSFVNLKLDKWNPFVIFVRDYQEKIFKDAEAEVPLSDLCELLAEDWENMSDAEQEVFTKFRFEENLSKFFKILKIISRNFLLN